MALKTVQKPGLAGAAVTYTAADAAGDTFPNDGRTVLHVRNGGAAGITVGVDSTSPCDYGFDHDLSATVAAGADRMIGPFAPNRFGTTVTVTYSAVTSVTIAVLAI